MKRRTKSALEEKPPGYPKGMWEHPWSVRQRNMVAKEKARLEKTLKRLKKTV